MIYDIYIYTYPKQWVRIFFFHCSVGLLFFGKHGWLSNNDCCFFFGAFLAHKNLVEILCTSTELGLDLCDNVVGEKKRVDLYESKRRNPGFGCFQKWGENPKMDGENHGKAYFLMDDLGRKPTIFGKHPFVCMKTKRIFNDWKRDF